MELLIVFMLGFALGFFLRALLEVAGWGDDEDE
jgi:hypothetical protein